MKNLNHTYKALLIALATLGTTIALAAPATIPNTFSSGTAAVAAEVNDNFTALKSAIDDNDSRINTPSGGFVSVSPQAFRNELMIPECRWYSQQAFFGIFSNTSTSTDCDAVAGIQLPHNASITSFNCYFRDTSLDYSINARLYRKNIDGSTDEIIFETPLTEGNSATTQALSDTTPANPGDEVVDNQNYSYSIMLDFDGGTDTVSAAIQFYNCTVGY